jgi:hypothetical protein
MMKEIEVEGVGIMRQVNDWQMVRIKSISNRENQQIAFVAFGLGMTIKQFKSLPPDKQLAAWDAHDRLFSPMNFNPVQPSRPRPPQPYQRVSADKMVEYGRRLIEVKEQLPHGHFRRWIEDESGITYAQAQRFMRAVKSNDEARVVT